MGRQHVASCCYLVIQWFHISDLLLCHKCK